ncbi:MAG TPA: cyclic pyranopterin monophosphate synthase MoaC [Cyclobacteriaceae bacterium]|nr:cyclic pyranopterin monophosphate synthase MoaC [Cyclobacteriaceae bacterium]
MAKRTLSHIDKSGMPAMVDVSEKKITERIAEAQAIVHLPKEVLKVLDGKELITKKGPVFQTATIAGVMAAKKTHELIPLCHPLSLEDIQVKIELQKDQAVINSKIKLTAKTGAEMEALTAASVAALTIYDMCKALSHHIIIKDVKLISKTGGKSDFSSR